MATQDPQFFLWHYSDLNDRNFEIRGRTLFFIIALFSIILIVTLLFLYARWVFRYQGHLQTSLNSVQSTQTPSLPSQGLDPVSIKKLPIILHQIPSEPNCGLDKTECCICLNDFKDCEKLKLLPDCGHCFHCECVDKWLTTQSSCPLCRASLQGDSSFPPILIEEPPIRINFLY